ncbi:spinster family MFS transporter [Alterisphingorhabdus coralli]|uniref:MFS transporter n=1 Tax=Alterisphingorhabdus coralli TaxID=3071408 RepID=A0AA97I149_9SPHN|nr:MFS transporter [Parasphingorhabdus sp. SCSIO 66989]WOE75692.1 MFS transporter [Parasphingorhabdus sp. SCSIO 66989]
MVSGNNHAETTDTSAQAASDNPDNAIDPDTQKASAYSWYVLGVLVLLYVLNFIDRNIIAILAEDIKKDMGLDDSQIGFLYGTAFGVFYALFGIPLGKLADSWHRVRLMTIGLTIWSAFTALSGFARNFATLSVARIGVGVGEATASPSAYSIISDYFPKRLRATALAIYSSGIYLGGGFSLFVGGKISSEWNSAFPVDPPLGLVGWQAAFVIVGLPGLLLALWLVTLREPLRGQSDGILSPPVERPFAGFFAEMLAVIPPFTLLGAARQGADGLRLNLIGLVGIALIALFLFLALGDWEQWLALGIGYYAIWSWALQLRQKDRPTFALIWGSPAFICTILGYGAVAFSSYAVTLNAPIYAIRELGISQAQAGLWIGGPGALGGFLGITIGGRVADALKQTYCTGRLWVVIFGVVAPVIPLIIAFTTTNIILFYILNFLMSLFASSALGAAAATTQDLVLPRMRGVATATFFLATTLVGLSLGPYMVGKVSDMSGSLTTGVLSLLAVAPIGLVLLIIAVRQLAQAEESVMQRAIAAGEPAQ